MEVHVLHLDHIFIDLKVLMINLLDKIKNLMKKINISGAFKIDAMLLFVCLSVTRKPQRVMGNYCTRCFDSNTDKGERGVRTNPQLIPMSTAVVLIEPLIYRSAFSILFIPPWFSETTLIA